MLKMLKPLKALLEEQYCWKILTEVFYISIVVKPESHTHLFENHKHNDKNLYFTENDVIETRRQKDEFSPRSMMNDTPLRYTVDLLTVDWEYLVEHYLPFLSQQRKNTILHVSGQFGINPLLILGKVIQEKNDAIHYAMKSDADFRISMKSFANNLSRFDHDFDAETIQIETSSLEYSLRKSFYNNEGLINNFLRICHTISRRYDLLVQASTTDKNNQPNAFKRNEDNKIGLELPFASSECWQLGSTHFGAQVTESSATNGKMSAIDMAPSLFQKWGVPFDYLSSNGEVYSAHSGHVKIHSECAMEVIHDQSTFSTYYSHLDLNDIDNGVFIEQGENIGRISLDDKSSNCRCDWPQKSFLCSTGPHLHMELRRNGKPESLQGHVISNIRIKTGLLPHDMHCSDPVDCSSAVGQPNSPIEGKLCATTFTDLSSGKVICPVTKGRNIGTYYFIIIYTYDQQLIICIKHYKSTTILFLQITI